MAGPSGVHAMTVNRQVVIEMNAEDVRRELQLIRSTVEQTAQTISGKLDSSLKRLGNQLGQTENKLRRTGQAARAAGTGMGFLNRNSEQTQLRLINLAAGAQGVMIGMSLLQRNLTGVGFGLIFLQFSVLKIAAAIAALTVVIGGSIGLIMAFSKLQKAALSAGNVLQEVGQRLTNFFRSTKIALDILRQAEEVTRRFGTDRAATLKSLDLLEQVGLRNSTIVSGILNTAAAVGAELDTVTERLVELSRASSDEIADLMVKFTRDFDIPMKQYKSAIEIATALNERFAGSAALMAETNVALARRVANTWKAALTAIGTVTVNFIQPILKIALAFTDALVEAFTKARNAAREAGEIADVVNSIREAAQRLIPVVVSVGRWLGTVLFAATLRAGRGLKVLIDIVRGFITRVKEGIDRIRGLVQEVKSISNPLAALAVAFKNPALAAGIGVALREVILGALKTIFGRSPGAIFKGIFAGLAGGIMAGLVLALLGLAGKFGIELLPFSDKIKDALTASLEIALLAGAAAAILGLPAVLATGIAFAIGAGVELIAPGSLEKLKEFGVKLAETIIEGLKKLPAFFEETVRPAMESLGQAIIDKVGPAVSKFVGWLRDDLLPEVRKLVNKLNEDLLPALENTEDTLANQTLPTWKRWLGVLKDLTFWIKDKLVRAYDVMLERFSELEVLEDLKLIWDRLKTAAGFLAAAIVAPVTAFGEMGITVDDAKDAIDRFVNFLIDHLVPVLVDVVLSPITLTADAIRGIEKAVNFTIAAIRTLIELIKKIPKPSFPDLPGLGDIPGVSGVFSRLDPRNLIPQSFGDLNPFSGALGGIVPGRLGQRVPVIAEAGERFGGAPMLERARPGAGGGGGGTVIVDLRGSVVANERAMNELAAKIGRSIFGRQVTLRSMTQHRP